MAPRFLPKKARSGGSMLGDDFGSGTTYEEIAKETRKLRRMKDRLLIADSCLCTGR